jgi:hypothetical protein
MSVHKKVAHHYTESELDNIYLLNGVHSIDEEGNRFTSINDLEQLHLAESETNDVMTRIEFEEQDHHWLRKAA